MIECVNCNPNCFDRTGSDCIVTASGQSLQSVLDGLVEDVNSLKEDVINIGSTNSVGEIGNLTSTNVPLSFVSPNPIVLTVKPGQTNTSVEYDLRKALPDSKQDVINVEVYGTVNGVTGTIYKGKTSVGFFNAIPSNFPLTLKVNATSLTSKGQVILTLNKSILNAASVTNEFPTLTDLTKTSLTSQKEVNTWLDTRISSLQNLVLSQSALIDQLNDKIIQLQA